MVSVKRMVLPILEMRKAILAFLIPVAIGASGCTVVPVAHVLQEERLEIADSIRTAQDSLHAAIDEERWLDALYPYVKNPHFDRIELARGGCVRCPDYRVTFFRDGGALFEGKMPASMMILDSSVPGGIRHGSGENSRSYSGTIDSYMYGRLCYVLERLNLLGMKRMLSYAVAFDVPSTNLRVWRSGETDPNSWHMTGDSGPVELWAFECLIDSAAERVFWTPMQQAPPSRR
jgi:hypothetical protein